MPEPANSMGTCRGLALPPVNHPLTTLREYPLLRESESDVSMSESDVSMKAMRLPRRPSEKKSAPPDAVSERGTELMQTLNDAVRALVEHCGVDVAALRLPANAERAAALSLRVNVVYAAVAALVEHCRVNDVEIRFGEK